MQSNPGHHASVSGQKQGGGSDAVSSRTRKKMTVALTPSGEWPESRKRPSQESFEATKPHRLEGLSPDLLPVQGRIYGTPSKKGRGGSAGQGGPKDFKSSTSSLTKSGSGKGSKRTGKEAGLPIKPRWLSSYKVHKLPAPDTSVSS